MLIVRSRTAAAILLCVTIAAPAQAGSAAGHVDAAEVRAMLSAPGHRPPDLAGRDLAGDDLSGLDLAHASLAGANLRGVKLVGTDLSYADLSRADLSETWIMKARFDHANLHGAILQTVITSTGMDNRRDTAASFVGADLSDTSATVHFSYDDMRGVNFTGTRQSVVLANQSMGMLRSEFVNADLDGADFTDAGLGRLTFEFAKLRGAVFRNADLTRADFIGADLTGADFTGAKLDGAVFDSATLTGVKGLPASLRVRDER